jgi:endonuclease/exonuclease/phosphatase family metal-dependent hydrolase
MGGPTASGGAQLRVATLNIRNMMDRWDERMPLVLAEMAAIQPDLLGLQEVIYPLQQDRLIGAAGAGHYATYRAWATRVEYGNSVLVKEPLVATGVERLELSWGRSALRTVVRVGGAGGADGSGGGRTLAFVTTHLHHPPDAAAERDDQATALLAWLEAGPRTDALVLCGDFNANPSEPAYARIAGAGFRSAYREANGAEPAVTWPSGLDAPQKDTDGDPACLDYIWLRGAVRAGAARLAWDRPAVADPTLYPSDHLGIVADLEVG